MPHLPAFPPIAEDWTPGNPFNGEPPLPRFLFNPGASPWLRPDERGELERRYGYWAVRRAEAMVPELAGARAAEAAARSMAERLGVSYGYRLPPIPRGPIVRRPRGRPPTVAGRRELTPEEMITLQADLRARLITEGRETLGREPTEAEIRDWMREELPRAIEEARGG